MPFTPLERHHHHAGGVLKPKASSTPSKNTNRATRQSRSLAWDYQATHQKKSPGHDFEPQDKPNSQPHDSPPTRLNLLNAPSSLLSSSTSSALIFHNSERRLQHASSVQKQRSSDAKAAPLASQPTARSDLATLSMMNAASTSTKELHPARRRKPWTLTSSTSLPPRQSTFKARDVSSLKKEKTSNGFVTRSWSLPLESSSARRKGNDALPVAFSGWLFVSNRVVYAAFDASTTGTKITKAETKTAEAAASKASKAKAEAKPITTSFSSLSSIASSSASLPTPSSLKYRRRYCKLRDALCTFHDTSSSKANDVDIHMVLHVTKHVAVNAGLLLTNQNGQLVYLYTESSEECDLWFNAFQEAIQLCQRSHIPLSNHWNSLTKKDMLTNINSIATSTENAITRGEGKDAAMITQPTRMVERSSWVLKESNCLFFYKRLKRRYLVLREATLVYFDINLAGRPAEGGGRIAQVQPWKGVAEGLEIRFTDDKKLRLQWTSQDQFHEWKCALEEAAVLTAVVATQAATSASISTG